MRRKPYRYTFNLKHRIVLVCGGRSCIWQEAVPYSQATGLPYCLPPAREYPSPSAAYRRRDTDSRRRQVTKLPKPCPQYPPFTLENGRVRFFSLSWVIALPVLPHTGFMYIGLSLVPLKLSY